MLTRRRFLAGASGGLVLVTLGRGRSAGVLGQSNAAARTEPEGLTESTEFPYTVMAPAVGKDGYYPGITVSQLTPYQGGAILITAINALAGSVSVFGRTYTMAMGPEGLSGFVGFGVLDPPGSTTMSLELTDTQNQPLNYQYEVRVRETQWTFDDIIIPPPPPPDPDAPPPPPPLPDEQPRLNELYAMVTPRRWERPFILPLTLGGDVFISGYFGEERSFNGGPRGGHHGGTDIGAPMGTEIHATNRGMVVLAEETRNRGNLVVLDHGAGIFSCYGHQSALRVLVGDVVERGDVLGLVGSTGLSSGPHLHWEMSVGGVLVDGLRWLDGTQGF
ncbi:MAG: M23 family metallopeptidase [Dehalococcoidia bacterium]